jgi:hypothetical protein
MKRRWCGLCHGKVEQNPILIGGCVSAFDYRATRKS